MRGWSVFQVGERRFSERLLPAAAACPAHNPPYGKYCADLARSGKFGNSEVGERRLGQARALGERRSAHPERLAKRMTTLADS